MKCLVTGGAGFIGSHLVEKLLKKGHQVVVIDNLVGGHINNLKEAKEHSNFQFYQKDIRDYLSIESLFRNVDWVFHLAALADIVPSIENPRDYFEVNVDGTFNVLEAATKCKVKKLVYAASSSCYGIADSYPTPENASIKPQYPYALTKYLGEEMMLHFAKVYDLPSISLRLFNVYGPRARTTGAYGAVMGVFLAQKLHNESFTVVGDGTQTRDFTYVTDVANAFYLAAASKYTNQVMNVGSGSHYSVNYLVSLLGGEKQYIPKRPGEPDCTFADVTKIRHLLQFKPEVSFEMGVNKLLARIDDFKEAPLWDKQSISKATEKWFHYLGNKSHV